MIRPPPRSTLSSSSAASDVYKRQIESISSDVMSSSAARQSCTTSDRNTWVCTGISSPAFPFRSAGPPRERQVPITGYVNPRTPVSYTHLRAHETPEHLVCRLLLEKKKKKTK
eukprot:TRINITY_DN66013_c0_g1_i1.p1 TRINITY_DN66013_c0_g1~~TRINITY_DN66013_c0_g1_i1.p1  ORF type:complete len:113 (-),score=37.96 TRINITY_DN66013_c0_g1_i1:21-359(-)